MRKFFVLGCIVLVLGAASFLVYGFQGESLVEAEGWEVTYYTMQDEVYDVVIGTATFPTEFDYDRLQVARDEEKAIGFQALSEMSVHDDVSLELTVIADDGVIKLIVDGEVLIDLEAPDPDRTETLQRNLKAGQYTFEIHYYQLSPVLEDDAHAAFRMKIPEERTIINAGQLALTVTGGAIVILDQQRKRRPTENARERDSIIVAYTFVYVFISIYVIMSIVLGG